MIKNKKAQGIKKIAALIILVVVVAIVISRTADIGVPRYIDSFIPDFLIENKTANGDGIDPSCPTIGRIGEFNKVGFCSNPDCSETVPINIIIEGTSIKVGDDSQGGKDSQVGEVINKEKLWIYPEIRERDSTEQDSEVYLKIKDAINFDDLLKVHEAILTGSNRKTICKKIITPTPEEHRINEFKVIRNRGIEGEVGVPGPVYYYNVDDLIKNKNKARTPLYFDKELTEKALSSVLANGDVERVPESFEAKFQPYEKQVTLIPVTRLHIAAFQELHKEARKELTVNRRTSEVFLIRLETGATYVDNSDNKLGVDSGKKPFTHLQYLKVDGRIYIKFYNDKYIELHPNIYFENIKGDEVIEKGETPFVLMDYWEAYQTFVRTPDWALVPVETK